MEKGNTAVHDLPIEDVYPNPKHYRDVTKENVDKIADSIAEAGQLVPIEVWGDGDIYYVDQGHHRLAAMKQLGHETIRAIVADAASAVSMVASNLSIPETELERSRGTQLMLETGVRPEAVAAHIGESAERVEKAMRGRERAGDAAEDMTLDRLIAVSDFADDPEAAQQIMTAREVDWQRIHKELAGKRKGAQSVARKKAIVEAAECELVASQADVAALGAVYLDSGDEMPEGATIARVSYDENWYHAGAEIFWYKAAGAGDDPEEVERQTREKEDAEMLRLALESMESKRIAFVGGHLAKDWDGAGSDYLRELAAESWFRNVNIWDHNVSNELADLKGFIPRVHAALISIINIPAREVMRLVAQKKPSGTYFDANASMTLKYYAALKGVGYEPTELEANLLATLETVVIDKAEEAEAAGKGATKR